MPRRLLEDPHDGHDRVREAAGVGDSDVRCPGYTLMVAGQRTAKSSLLRLLLDTSHISPSATDAQLAGLVKFVQASARHTAHIRAACVPIRLDCALERHLNLALVDTPALDFADEPAAERTLADILRHLDARFADGLGSDAAHADHHVHLCIYVLDPAAIVPPAVPAPPAPFVPRPRAASLSQPDPDPVILEPPVTSNPLLARPTLPAAEINAIRRLSARVNVLPVIARADTLSNDRLTAVKLAVRRDLAEAGIGFGIFDMDPPSDPPNGFHHPAGPASSSSPPASPASPSLRLPYALISPDSYAHSDGVAKMPLSRHELAQHYTPSPHLPSAPKMPRGKYIRSYRWGTMDVLDPQHSDFAPLRMAIFHHMETLQKYTRDYLFVKYKTDYRISHHPSSSPVHTMQSSQQQAQAHAAMHHPRPVLAIDTSAPRHPPLPMLGAGAPDLRPVHLARSLPEPEHVLPHAHQHAHAHSHAHPHSHPHAQIHAHTQPKPASVSSGTKSASTSKQRTKKITVACNFCRSRKLKCDGGRPACSQCLKRTHPCDYMPQNNKRRSALRPRKHSSGSGSALGGSRGGPVAGTGAGAGAGDEESDSDAGASADERSGEADDHPPSLSPEILSLPPSRRGSIADRRALVVDGDVFGAHGDAGVHAHAHPLVHPHTHAHMHGAVSPAPHTFYKEAEMLPHIATLALGDSPSGASAGAASTVGTANGALMSAPALPPLRPASEQQAAQRKRASTVPGRSNRQAASAGPKVVACNFCRARKTKCDGAHPACSSCARRSLPCNYNHDSVSSTGAGTPNGTGRRGGGRRASTSTTKVGSGSAASPASNSPPLSSNAPQMGDSHVASSDGQTRRGSLDEVDMGEREGEAEDLKRKMKIEDEESAHLKKRMRVENLPTSGIP